MIIPNCPPDTIFRTISFDIESNPNLRLRNLYFLLSLALMQVASLLQQQLTAWR